MSASDKLPSRKQPGNPDCLHCRLVETIYAHFDAKGAVADGETVLDMQEVAESVGQVLAEFFAGHDDKKQRDRRLKELFHAVRDEIPVIRGRGDGAFPRHVELH